MNQLTGYRSGRMVSDMDKKSAMKILGLGPNATAPDAKHAFRTLAKSFHPDRFAREPRRAATAEIRMKDINAAFKFIFPLLPETSPSEKKTTASSDQSISSFFTSVTQRFKTRPKPGPKAGQKSSVGVKAKASPPGKQEKPPKPPPVRSRQRRTPRFDAVLHDIEPGMEKTPLKRKSLRPPTDPYDTYSRHMAVKKKIQKRRCRSEEMGIGRVEKISPVQRVNPISDD